MAPATRGMATRTVRHRRWALAPAALFAAAGTATQASAQWTVVSLHPDGAPRSEARGVENGQQVGFVGFDAVVWSGTADSAVVLDPTPAQSARATCILGGTQFGSAEVFDSFEGQWRTHAAMWTGTAASFVDLHPPEIGAIHSRVSSAHGSVLGGSWYIPDGSGSTFGLDRPCMWTSASPDSFVDLTPPGVATGEVRGVFGNQQVGAHFDFGLANAVMWTGTPESYVDLNPPGALFSAAECTDGVHQYGAALFLDFSTGEGNIQAGYWSGTADSWVDMTPPSAPGGSVAAVDGAQQVGSTAGDVVGNPPYRAALWNGSAASYVDLHTFVPAGYSQSQALDIWHDPSGYAFIVGYATNDDTGEPEAIMWLPARPGADLITSVFAPADCTVAPGRAMNYNVRIDNAGLDVSGPVTVTVDLPDSTLATYASASPAPTSATPTTLTFDLPALGGGASTNITVTLTAVAENADVPLSAAAATTADYDMANNSDAATASTLATVLASDYVEVGDAPELGGGQVIPAGPLALIEGELNADADMYQIRVDDWAAFSATILRSQLINDCRGIDRPLGDTELMLFDANGFGITLYNGTPSSPASLLAGDPGIAGRTNGEVVWLAISQYNYLPTSGGLGNFIWFNDPFDLPREPDGPAFDGAVDGWEKADGSGTGKFTYRIELTGVSGVPTPPTCAADLDNSGAVDVFDLLAYLDLWFVSDAAAELTGDAPANIDVFDLLAYLDGWFAGC